MGGLMAGEKAGLVGQEGSLQNAWGLSGAPQCPALWEATPHLQGGWGSWAAGVSVAFTLGP